MNRILILLVLFIANMAFAETSINTTGSDDNTAISGFDTVSFFTDKKAVLGKREYEFTYLGAKWLFSSSENLELFVKDPEKYMPEWGGQCAWCVSENCVSKKKITNSFEFINNKLYLFSSGNDSKDGAKNGFLYSSQFRPSLRIVEGNKNWLALKPKLEQGEIVQPNASTYRKTKFD